MVDSLEHAGVTQPVHNMETVVATTNKNAAASQEHVMGHVEDKPPMDHAGVITCAPLIRTVVLTILTSVK